MRSLRAGLGRLAGAREAGLLAAILIVVGIIVVCGKSKEFFGATNQVNLWRQIGLLGMFAVGEAVVIIAGGIDLSVGSVIAFAGMVGTLALNRLGGAGGSGDLSGGALLSGVLAALGVGLLTGLLHTLLITRLKLPPFIATLGTLAGLRSAAELITNSVPVTCAYERFRVLSQGTNPLYAFLVVLLLVGLMMRGSRAGRQIAALGGNEEAARLSGLATGRLKGYAYGVCAVLAALGGVFYAAYSGQGDPRAGQAYELRAIAACVVGGCSLAGGEGTILGVALGVLLLEITLNGIMLVVSSNPTQWQGLVVGVVVIAAVALNNARQRRLGKR
ncbi:MAG: ABC transporter permease [Fimbriimonadaceae bacterium]|nr:ABC transporter permease [Fimbriimonadaceae bacterium]